MTLRFRVNGDDVRIDDPDPNLTVLAWLRARGLTGAKEGCAEGECGACTIALVEPGRFRPLNSCLLPLAALEGEAIVTVEGVSSPAEPLHPVQEALVREGGSQCGYCTPGFVVSLFCEYYRPGREGYDPESIAGNLCRCTGYRPIEAAARSLGPPAEGDRHLVTLRTRAPRAASRGHQDAHDGRRFLRPTSLAEVFDAQEAYPGAVLLAGGTDLMVYVNQRGTRYETLIALDRVPELRELSWGPGSILLGAGVPLSEIEERRADANPKGDVPPLLSELWPLFSSRLIRNRATFGGNLGTASPIGDSLPALLALDAEVTLASRSGERHLPLTAFFLGYRQTALAPSEVIVRLRVPLPFAPIQRFYKVSKRAHDDISTVSAAFALELTEEGQVARLAAAYGGVAATPIRVSGLEAKAQGRPWTQSTVLDLLGELDAVAPLGDHRGSAAYRKAMVRRLFERFFAETTHDRQAAE